MLPEVPKYNLTPTNILHALVSHDIDKLTALDNPRYEQGVLVPRLDHTDAFGIDMGLDFYKEWEEE